MTGEKDKRPLPSGDEKEFARVRSANDANSANEYARAAAQTTILLNGGAAVAIIGFVGQSEKHLAAGVFQSVGMGLLLYGVGAILGAVSMTFMWVAAEGWAEYWRHIGSGNKDAKDAGRGRASFNRNVARFCFLGSIVAFVIGSLFVGTARLLH